jgi:hypothetical protein
LNDWRGLWTTGEERDGLQDASREACDCCGNPQLPPPIPQMVMLLHCLKLHGTSASIHRFPSRRRKDLPTVRVSGSIEASGVTPPLASKCH